MVELAVDDDADAGEEEECRLSVLLKVYVDNIMRPNRVFVVVVVFSVADDVPKALLCRQMNECTRSLATAHIQPASQSASQPATKSTATKNRIKQPTRLHRRCCCQPATNQSPNFVYFRQSQTDKD